MPSLFVDDKQKFFHSVSIITSIDDINTLANQKDFAFLTRQRGSIEHEFNHLQAVLKNKHENHITSWLYCYYTAHQLKNYYDTYSPGCPNAIKYATLCDTIKKRFEGPVIVAGRDTLLTTLGKDLSELTTLPFSNTKLRGLSGKANMQRLSTRFSMITVKQTLLLANQYHFLDQLEQLMGLQVNIAILDAPLGVYNALSVALFGSRFFLNLAMLLKHTFTENSLSMGERFYEEIKKRHYQMTNDLIWGVVNALSNFGAYFHVAASVANFMMIGFTVFDVLWLGYLLYMTDQDFASKRNEYFEYMGTLDENSAEYALEQQKLDQLELAHEKARTEVIFYLVAANILLSTFATVFLIAPAAFVPLCFFICNIAIAMYLSGSQYGEYKEKCFYVEQQKNKGLEITAEAMQDVQRTWDNLCFTVAKNTIAPLVILSAFTLSAPLAILLTLTYMAYESGYLTRLPELFVGKEEPDVVLPMLV